MALTTVTGNIVSVNAIQGTLIADNAITAVHIATNAVSGTLIADNAVTAVHIAQNSITVTQLADDCVESDKIADGIITTNHLNKAMISSQTEVTAATGDFVLLGDTSDSNNLKKTPVSSIIGLASGTTINNNADNRIITGSGSANTLNGESSLQFDGTNLTLADGDFLYTGGGNFDIKHETAGQNILFHTKPSGGSTTERMRITSAGNVGINRTSPNGLLHMQSSSGTDSAVYIQTSATSDDSIINFGDNGSSAVGKILYQHSSDSMQFNTQSSERMRIDNAGNMLLGTTSHSTGAFGAATGINIKKPRPQVLLQDTTNNTDGYLGLTTAGLFLATQDALSISFHTSDVERMRITSAGNVGIGTTSPSTELHVYSADQNALTIQTNTGINQITMANSTNSPTYITANSYVLQLKADDNGWGGTASGIHFRVKNAEYARVTPKGLSIGDTDGDYENRNGSEGLHVKRGGILMNGPPGDANMSSDTNGNQWTYHGQGGRGGNFTSVYFSIPNPNTGASGVGYGGFSVEFYIAGYNAKYHSGHYSGYVNNGITQSASGFYATSGSSSIAAVSVGSQGFKITVSFPSMTHPTAKFVVNKGGHGGSGGNAAYTDMSGAQIGWA